MNTDICPSLQIIDDYHIILDGKHLYAHPQIACNDCKVKGYVWACRKLKCTKHERNDHTSVIWIEQEEQNKGNLPINKKSKYSLKFQAQ